MNNNTRKNWNIVEPIYTENMAVLEKRRKIILIRL